MFLWSKQFQEGRPEEAHLVPTPAAVAAVDTAVRVYQWLTEEDICCMLDSHTTARTILTEDLMFQKICAL